MVSGFFRVYSLAELRQRRWKSLFCSARSKQMQGCELHAPDLANEFSNWRISAESDSDFAAELAVYTRFYVFMRYF
jgi:hypothetical protein